jgi:hypothetical protein
LDQHPRARLVVIDVFKRVRPETRSKELVYDADYRAMVPLKQLADERSIAILVVHHTRKAPADDPFDTVSGSTGLTGAADAVLVLARASDGGITLYGRGRDIEEIETAVKFDRVDGSWSILGPANDVRRSDERTEILRALRGADQALSPLQVSKQTGQSHDAVRQTLARMWQAGEVQRRGEASTSLLTLLPPVTTVTRSQVGMVRPIQTLIAKSLCDLVTVVTPLLSNSEDSRFTPHFQGWPVTCP